MVSGRAKTVSEYIAAAPVAAQKNLRDLRALLSKVAPDAAEAIKWGVPVLEEERILFSYSAHRAHINFMPTGSALRPFKAELEAYKTGKDTIQLPHQDPIPKALIRKIATYRLKQVKEEGALWMSRRK
jgi:uncharacterized protein YdhG (YjbR/CyaY superfamily)